MKTRLCMIAANLLVVLMTVVTILSCLLVLSEAYSQENPEKIKILFLAANPHGTDQLQLDEEIRAINAKLLGAEYRDIELISAGAVRPNDLLQLLNQHKPQIVHFSGHGTEKGEIVLVDDKTGEPKPISRDAIRVLFRTLKNNIRLVVLNSCYSKSQAQAIVENIDCAVGMNTSIGDTAAITFAASFYRALGFGASIQNAFDQGKTALLLEGIPEDKTPELLCRKGIDASQIFLVADPPVPRKPDLPAYGLDFQKMVWKHYYRANGDYQGGVEYYVKNVSNDSIVILPPHWETWSGWHIQRPNFSTKIFDEGKNAYSIEQLHISEAKDIRTDLDGKKREATTYLWQFNISPSLSPQKSLHYEVIAESKATELEAFTPDGSFAGMGSPYPVAELSCELYAPEGYRFKKESMSYFVRDRSGNMKDFAGLSKPEFRDNDTRVIWSVHNPTPNLSYLIKVIIVGAN